MLDCLRLHPTPSALDSLTMDAYSTQAHAAVCRRPKDRVCFTAARSLIVAKEDTDL